MGKGLIDTIGNPGRRTRSGVTCQAIQCCSPDRSITRLIRIPIHKINHGDKNRTGPDVSREGVQRDILPIVEGCGISTKYGLVRTDHILFIAAGAFHAASPSDLIPELQGRFPIRVELHALGKDDFARILKEPENALTLQYEALMATEGIELDFRDDAVDEVAQIAHDVNTRTENIGARRLHTVMEKLLDEVSFSAHGLKGQRIVITRQYVREKLQDIVKDEDLSRYIL